MYVTATDSTWMATINIRTNMSMEFHKTAAFRISTVQYSSQQSLFIDK